MDTQKLIGLMEKIELQNSNVITESHLNLPSVHQEDMRFPYAPFVKNAINIVFTDVANRLRLDGHSINTGRNFIESVMEYKRVKCPDELNRFSYNRNSDLQDTALESTFNCIIESYGRLIRKENTKLNKITGYNEDYISTSNKQVIDAFEKEVVNSSPKAINEKIADRVEKATQEFIEKRKDDTERVKDIYNAVQRIQNDDTQDDNTKEMANEAFKANLSIMRDKPVSLFESLVVNLSTAVLKDEGLKSMYMKESKSFDMGKIIDDVSAIYAVMETCNVYGFLKMDHQFVQDFMDGFKNN